MAWIPDDAEWYIADLVLEIRVAGDPRSVVHINTILVHANSPEEAYASALELGREAEDSYDNPEGQLVAVRFRGVHALNVVYEKLEHGAELFYSERTDLSGGQIEELLSPREELAVFRDIAPPEGPNYAAKDIAEEALRLIEGGANPSQDPATTKTPNPNGDRHQK